MAVNSLLQAVKKRLPHSLTLPCIQEHKTTTTTSLLAFTKALKDCS